MVWRGFTPKPPKGGFNTLRGVLWLEFSFLVESRFYTKRKMKHDVISLLSLYFFDLRFKNGKWFWIYYFCIIRIKIVLYNTTRADQ